MASNLLAMASNLMTSKGCSAIKVKPEGQQGTVPRSFKKFIDILRTSLGEQSFNVVFVSGN